MLFAMSDAQMVAVVGFLSTVVPASIAAFVTWRTSSSSSKSKNKLDLMDNLQEEISRIAGERDKLQQIIDELRKTVAQIQLDYTKLQIAYVRDVGALEARVDELQRSLGQEPDPSQKLFEGLMPPFLEEGEKP